MEEKSMEKKNNNEYKLIIELLKEARDDYVVLKDTMLQSFSAKYGIKGNPLETIIKFSKEEINNLTDEEVLAYLKKYESNISDPDDARKAMLTILDGAIVVYGSKKQVEELEKEADDIISEYADHASSDKVYEDRINRIKKFEESLELIESDNDIERHKIEKKIRVLKECLDFSFITKPFDTNEKKTVDSINRAFFTADIGHVITDKFSGKINKFGFDDKIYRYFFNLEEKFLPEKYHPFNNLFLFIYMRAVRYSDPYNKDDFMRIQSITSAMANLVYHKFPNTETEKAFVSIMQNTIDHFLPYTDLYREKNTTWCEHPARLEAEKANEIVRKKSLIKKMDELGITGYDENATADGLQRFLNDETDKLIDKRNEEEKKELVSDDSNSDAEVLSTDKVSVETSDDGSVNISPNFNKESEDNTNEEHAEPEPEVTAQSSREESESVEESESEGNEESDRP